MAVPLLDLKRQYATIKDEMDRAIQTVMDHGLFILGPEVKQLEDKIAGLCGLPYGIGVASGTDALLLSLHAAGIGPGDEVITSDYSFFASAGVISRLGAIPVFVDIEEDTFNIDPAPIEKVITAKTKAIMPAHLYGQVADMDPIMELAGEHDLAVIEDAAQAIGAEYKGKKAGAIGDFGCFSFYPSKNLGGIGDGGMVVTGDPGKAEMVTMLRLHGWKVKYRPLVIGYNSRLDTLQAAALLVKLKYLEEWTELRREHAARYDTAFLGTSVKTPIAKEYSYHIYNQYTILVENRDELLKVFREKEIGFDIYYPVPFHLMECYKGLSYRENDFPVSVRTSRTALSLPIFPELTEAEQDEVISAVRSVSG